MSAVTQCERENQHFKVLPTLILKLKRSAGNELSSSPWDNDNSNVLQYIPDSIAIFLSSGISCQCFNDQQPCREKYGFAIFKISSDVFRYFFHLTGLYKITQKSLLISRSVYREKGKEGDAFEIMLKCCGGDSCASNACFSLETYIQLLRRSMRVV